VKFFNSLVFDQTMTKPGESGSSRLHNNWERLLSISDGVFIQVNLELDQVFF